ncbi:MAG: FAD-binding oxidoreductase [Actinomycetia bacterium]|nr:FAD-binding oxidoreductase [Actinomycetes bacterium]MCP5034397.1 FAD-binding oxidoreductase [Actinomycetes bacterium]
MTTLPPSARYVIVGGGIHGLSTAWHLAKEIGSGVDVVVLEKGSHIGSGASGIACGVIRNNYFQPAMRELMAYSVRVWESDPEAFSYHPVGYLQISHEGMHDDVATIYGQQQAIGYESSFIEGADTCQRYMEGIFLDWQAKGITSVLHEKKGGYANNMRSLEGLKAKCLEHGVSIIFDVKVEELTTDSEPGPGAAVTAVVTDQGSIACDNVVVAVGPWVQSFWSMLDLPTDTSMRGPDGTLYRRPTWTYWALQEGTLGVDPRYLVDNEGNMPPVVHIDTDAPLYDDNGDLVTEEPWGIYYKPDFYFGGVQGGYMPYIVDKPASEVAVDPYGPASPDFVVGGDFYRTWTAALAHCQKRFEGQSHLIREEPSGGIGSFSPDSFPILDTFNQNVFFIADSNHGYKMIGVGALVAKEVLGQPQALLEPFRYSRYAEGRLHPVSNSPYPWS